MARGLTLSVGAGVGRRGLGSGAPWNSGFSGRWKWPPTTACSRCGGPSCGRCSRCCWYEPIAQWLRIVWSRISGREHRRRPRPRRCRPTSISCASRCRSNRWRHVPRDMSSRWRVVISMPCASKTHSTRSRGRERPTGLGRSTTGCGAGMVARPRAGRLRADCVGSARGGPPRGAPACRRRAARRCALGAGTALCAGAGAREPRRRASLTGRPVGAIDARFVPVGPSGGRAGPTGGCAAISAKSSVSSPAKNSPAWKKRSCFKSPNSSGERHWTQVEQKPRGCQVGW